MECIIHGQKECHDCSRVFLEHSHDAMIVVDENAVIVVFNQAAERMFGLLADEVKGQKLSMIMPPDFGSRHDQLIIQTFKDDEYQILGKTLEVTGWHQPKGKFPVELSLSKVEITDKPFILAVVRDISEKKDYIERLKVKRNQLRELNESLETKLQDKELELTKLYEARLKEEKLALLGRALSEVSHDIRGPLGVISNAIYMLKLADAVTPKYLDYLDLMKEELHKALTMLEGMRYFLKSQRPTLRQVKIIDVLRESGVYRELNELDILQLDLKAEKVWADRHQLERVLSNLISNASDALKTTDDPVIVISSRVDNGFAIIQVSDNGTGIKEEDQAKLFEPLFTTKRKGLGIGLASCQSIIQNFGGEISFVSRWGEGTTFSIKLPIGRGDENGG